MEKRRWWAEGQADEDLLLLDGPSGRVEVVEGEGEVTAVIALGDVDKKEIKLTARSNLLKVRAGARIEHVYLPVEVDPGSARATYKNGVLQVAFKKS
ncbi:MAG: hypothetical protein QXT68_04630 [Halobacteria archaeon]